MNESCGLLELANKLYPKCTVGYSYVTSPFGGNVPIPLVEESAIVDFLISDGGLSAEQIAPVRKDLSRQQAYFWLFFSVRMAIHAVRISNCKLIEAGIAAILIEDRLADWRDILVALSLIEGCANRIGADFRQLMESKISLAGEELRKTIVDGYLSRSTKMRAPEVMGYTSSGEGSSFGFFPRI